MLTQLAAAAPALNRAEFKIISSGLGRCVLSSEEGREQAEADRLQLEKLFLARA